MSITRPVIILLLLLWSTSSVTSAKESDVKAGRPPAGHGYHAMAYDSSSQRIILYGGQTGDIFTQPETFLSSDTWALDPVRIRWQLLNPAVHPPAITAHAMTHNARTNKIILYGGVVMTEAKEARIVRQTWTFDSLKETWQRASDGPPERYGHRMVDCAKLGLIVLFGGARVDAATKDNAMKLADTWVYDAAADRWKDVRLSVSPSPRHYFGMAYDSGAERVIVWGGAHERAPDAASVWAYDVATNTWTERKPINGPASSSYVAMAYDPRTDKTIVYGGTSNGSDQTWTYDYKSNSWSHRLPEKNPGSLSRMPLVYASAINRTVLFGGQMETRRFVYSNETWLYHCGANTWENVTSGGDQ